MWPIANLCDGFGAFWAGESVCRFLHASTPRSWGLIQTRVATTREPSWGRLLLNEVPWRMEFIIIIHNKCFGNSKFYCPEWKFVLPNWSWARQPLCSARSTLLYPFQMLNAKQGSSNSHPLTSFGMTRPGIEPATSRTWGGHSNH